MWEGKLLKVPGPAVWLWVASLVPESIREPLGLQQEEDEAGHRFGVLSMAGVGLVG